MQELAINGGIPIRTDTIYYGKQNVEQDDINAVSEVLRGLLITCGPKVEEAEAKLQEMLSVRYASIVSNGTAALHCACIASGIQPGDEVITTPLTFAASANCILYCGGKPVFADINPHTWNIDPQSIEDHVTEKTKAVIAVDYTGQAVEYDKIRDVCDRYKLTFIEDAAHAIGTLYNGKPVGSLADMTCFSFHPVKTVTSGEGGAITTNDDEFHRKLVLAHLHGITHDSYEMSEFASSDPWYYEQLSLGYNYRMTDFQAALLISQLSKLQRFKERRQQISNRYNESFTDLPGIILQENIPESDTCRHLYVIRLDTDKLSCTRREFYDAMCAENVQPQVHYIPVYWFPYYQSMGYRKGLCPVAEGIYDSIISLPLYPAMTDKDVEDVINAVRKVTEYYAC